MVQARIQLDSRADHNALMAQLCEQAAAALARRINLTADPATRAALQRRMREHEAQSDMHRKLVEQLGLTA